uniref:Interleukin 9 receptor n=1 Tax=Mus musculus TaxID=10090 RepID=F8WJ69_MOUSE
MALGRCIAEGWTLERVAVKQVSWFLIYSWVCSGVCRGVSVPEQGGGVKLDPPSDLQSNVSSGRCVLTWGINLALEPLITSLSYELAFKRQEEAWEVTW